MTDADARDACEAAQRLARAFPNLRVLDDDGAPIPLSTAMWVRVALVALELADR